MLAVGARVVSQCATELAVLFGVFSHAPAKISMGKVGLRHKASATHDEGALTCLALAVISRAVVRSHK